MHQFKSKKFAVVLVTLCALGFPLASHANDLAIASSNIDALANSTARTDDTGKVPENLKANDRNAIVTSGEATKAAENTKLTETPRVFEDSAPVEVKSAPTVSVSAAGMVRVAEANRRNEMAKQADPAKSIMTNERPTAMLIVKDTDIWARIRKGFAIPDLDNPLVKSQLNWYTTRPDYIQRTTTRASLYLFHVVEELEKRHMPTELALLPFIESAFNPQANSIAHAAGMWQFIPSTGRNFNLKQNVFKDERRDVIASTDAALSYLQKLYGMFGDWQLALAAYNWGEGSVQRAINRNRAAGKPIDFNSLSVHMPLETRNYVPKLQAVKNIIATPEQYAIALPKVDNEPYFVTIGKTRDIDIKVAAQLAEISIDEFKALNPQFNRPVITGGANTQILLPQSNADKFKLNLSNWGHALSSWTIHKVTSAKEKIEAIAQRFGTTPAVIREANNIPPKMHLMPGSTILVPKSIQSVENDIAPEIADKATMAVESDNPTRRIFVRAGKRDSLASIAQRNRVSVAQLRTWNNLKTDKLVSGQRLQLQVPYRVAVGGAPKKNARRNSRPSTKVAMKKNVRSKTVVAAAKPANNTRKPVPNQRIAVTLASTK